MAMADKDIIKALECCAGDGSCAECPYDVGCVNGNHRLAEDTLKLIKRQQAEINRLKRYDEERDIRLHARLTALTRVKAIKEFAEEIINDILPKYTYGHEEIALRISLAISEKVKELMEVQDNV